MMRRGILYGIFFSVKGSVNALNLSNLLKDIIGIKKGQVLQVNETDLFQQMQDLGTFSNLRRKSVT